MPVKVKCTNCEKNLSVPDAARGKAVKCPQCQTRLAVPAEVQDSGLSSKSSSKKPKTKKPSRPLDSEAALASFDMRRAEDTEARICSKCGFDMVYQDEEDTECPQCGFDSEAGGMGVKARKKAMKGPDPADFYPGLVKQSWKFVIRNQMLAWRTVSYTLICLTVSLLCAFCYLYISMWPPRAFFALCFVISFLVIPGWMWFLDVEVIKLTLERKDKFKRLNFDFFLSSAMGVAFVAWCAVILVPVAFLPALIGYVLVNYAGSPDYVLPIMAGIGGLLAIWMLPVSMSHMAMPIQFKGWLFWKVVTTWANNLKPLSFWFLWFLITNIPLIGCGAVIGALYGQDLVTIVQTMEDNAYIARQKVAALEKPETIKGQAPPPPVQIPDPTDVNFRPLIVPGILLVVMFVINGFTSLFNMRTNGQFTYYNKNTLDMVDRRKEYKYVAKERGDEDEDEKPRTVTQDLVDAVVLASICIIMGGIGGMLYGTLTDVGVPIGILRGVFWGSALAFAAARIQMSIAAWDHGIGWGLAVRFLPFAGIAFTITHWEEARRSFFSGLIAMVSLVTFLILWLAGIVMLFGARDQQPANVGAPSAVQATAEPGQAP